jgi:hypothetical protein
MLEVGWSARNADHYRQMMDDLAWRETLEITQSTLLLWPAHCRRRS